MVEGLIELGERADVGDRARRGRRSNQGALAGLVTAAVLLAVAGSGGPPPRLSGPVWTTADVAGFDLGQGVVYTLTGDSVEARAADTGQLRWRSRPGGAVDKLVELGHGLVAISALPAASADADSADTIIARIATGDAVTTAHGRPVAWSAEQLLVGRRGCGSTPACYTLSAVSLPDASAQWTMEVPTARAFSIDPGAGVFAMQTDDELQLRDLATGALLRAQPLPADARRNGTGSGSQRLSGTTGPDVYGTVVAGNLVTVRRTGAQTIVDGQPVAGTKGGWSVTLPAVPVRPATGFLIARPCGELVCVFVDFETSVIDPGTGIVRARVPGLVISDPIFGVPGQYLLVQPSSGTGFEVLRARDLSVVASLPLATPLTWQSGDGRIMFSRVTADGISLAVIDRRGHQRTIGSVPGGEIICGASGLILACLDRRTLTTWRIPGPGQLAAGVGDGRP